MTSLLTHKTKKLLAIVATVALASYAQLAQATPKIQHWQNEHGSKVYFVAAPELPMIDIRITFDAGSARDHDIPGLALMTNGLLAEGTSKLDADAIAESFENVGANFDNSVDRDSATISLRSLTDEKWFEPALETFITVLSDPSFSETVLERERQRALIALRGQKQSPQSIIGNAFYKNLYAGHAYAAPTLGYEKSIKAMTRANIQLFYQRHYVASNATIAIVGDLDHKEAVALANRLTAKLGKEEKLSRIDAVNYSSAKKRVHIEHPSTQTHIMVGMPSHARGDKDHFALFLGNHILGGSGFGSHITKAIREDRGLAYSAYSYIAAMRAEGPLVIGLQTSTNQTDEALQVLHDTLAAFLKNGPNEEELIAAKQDIINGFPLRIASNSSLLDYVSLIGFYGLSLDYLDDFTDKIDKVSKEDVRNAFAKRIKLDQLLTVTVGQSNPEQ
ncbi:MAG: insulinase family protein [Thiotrichales bacterium]|nr:insulinase family protein [Thiotrichales bacterium]